MFTLAQLEVFVCVAESGSFNKAAEDAYITPSAVMKHINKLEKEIGAPVFERTHRGQQLTKVGEELYHSAIRILELCENALVNARSVAKHDLEVVRLGTSIMYPPEVFNHIWSEIHKKHPEIAVEIVPFDSTPTIEGYTIPQPGTSIDMVITTYDEVTLKNKEINGFEVTRVPLCAIMAANHRLSSKNLLTLEDLEGETLLTIRNGMSDDIKAFRASIAKRDINVNFEEIYAYGIEIYNRCASSDDILIGMGQEVNVHPMIKRIPIDCEQSSAFGFLYAKEPTHAVAHFIKVVQEIVAAGKSI